MIIRATIFNILFYGMTVIMAVVGVPILLLPYRFCQYYQRLWSWVMVFLLRHVIGLRHTIRGELPQEPVIFAAKHQSAWETIFLYGALGYPAPVMKRELIYLPLIGLYFMKVPSVAIDRSTGRSALKKLMASARRIKALGASILIFPQGTRTRPAQSHPYHSGIFALYQATGLPVVPIALNSGLFWGRSAFTKRGGVITVELLSAIPAGLGRHDFMARLESDIETATKQLEDMA